MEEEIIKERDARSVKTDQCKRKKERHNWRKLKRDPGMCLDVLNSLILSALEETLMEKKQRKYFWKSWLPIPQI